jgi:hypothetical protein
MNSDLFVKKIVAMIEECSANYFLVKKDERVRCDCVDHTTRQPFAGCKKCLGTGYKVSIKKIRGACFEEMKGGATLSSKTSRIIRTYYTTVDVQLSENDFIIDQGEVYYVYRIATLRGLDGKATHKQITTVLKSEDHDKIYKNFKAIVDKKLTPAQKGEFPWLM